MNNPYKVVKGDSLWKIAKTRLSEAGRDPTDTQQIVNEVQRLATKNHIKNKDLIYVGQLIYHDYGSGGSGEAASEDELQVAIEHFGLQADADNVLFVTWSWVNHDETEHYEVRWDYYTSNFIWFGGKSSTSNVTDRWHTYNIPSNAKQVRVRIRPISKKTTTNGKEATHWTAEWSSWKTFAVENKPDPPGKPNLDIAGLELTASVSGIKEGIELVKFEVSKADGTVVKTGSKVKVETGSASFKCTVAAGFVYTVRCQVSNDDVWSDWSDYSDKKESAPAVPGKFTKCEPGEPASNGEPTIVLEWPKVETADKYDIEYTDTKSYFDTTNSTTTVSVGNVTTWQIPSGLKKGTEYFFRIRSANDEGEVSAWSEVSSCIIGSAPSPPTTWSSTSTVIVGEPLYLYWTHNSEDGSTLKYSQITITVLKSVLGASGEYEWEVQEVIEPDPIDHTKDEDKSSTGKYEFDTSGYEEGIRIQWSVKTAGISKVYSDYSIQRAVDIYAKPTLDMSVTDNTGSVFETLTSFPFDISAVPGPASQAPVWYHLEIISNQFYETVDNAGNARTVNKGEQVYSKHFDIKTALTETISAGNVHLENNVSYTITCTVSMNSGLVASASRDFTVAWSTADYSPNAEIGVDPDTLSAYISPRCTKHVSKYHRVNYIGGTYITTTETFGYIYGTARDGVFTTTGEQVYYGTSADGEDLYYCIVVEETNVEGLTLSVYRREFDGTFTKLEPEVSSASRTFITDPHPSLDYARYRIVARSDTTGQVRYYDPPGYPVSGKSVVIQWNEEWSEFDSYGSEDAMEQPPWAGSMLKLPYNIDVSSKYSPDVSLIEYVGRKHPVSYYGTQLGESATWNVEIEKSDTDTLYALRRLSIWMGDVYVREPSGSGYWAHVKVSFSQKHGGLTIPVSLEVTRVEGGA